MQPGRGVSCWSYLEPDAEPRLVEVQLRLEAERVKLLGDDQGTLRAQSYSQLSEPASARRLSPPGQIIYLVSVSGNFLLFQLLREKGQSLINRPSLSRMKR